MPEIVVNVVRYFLGSSNTCCCFGPQANGSALLRVRKKGRILLADLDMNLFSDTRSPASFCTCFLFSGGLMLRIALIFSGFVSIPYADMRQPMIFPFLMSTTHFYGLSLSPSFLCLRRFWCDMKHGLQPLNF